MSAPDVSVIVPVYNTMPYLTACLDSLVGQSLAETPGRMEVIAVDDGSTDGSGEELERYAGRHPDLFTVVHQPNSGGPAAPCNRGLDRARGRFVYFLGADDYLGTHAMQRLVETADEWDSDVIFGKAVGTNDRYIWQPIFDSTERDLDIYGRQLAFAVSNSKMFRRSLIEEHSIRYPEHLSVGSDQPFAIEAMVHARRISVLSDDVYLYVVRREDASNISYATMWHDRIECIEWVMDYVTALVPDPVDRDALLTRHFTWEFAKLVSPWQLELDEAERGRLCAALKQTCARYLTDRIRDRLPAPTRLRYELVERGDLAHLDELNRLDDDPAPPLHTDGHQLLLELPGLRDPAWGVPDWAYVTRNRNLDNRLRKGLTIQRFGWDGDDLVLEVDSTLGLLDDAQVPARLSLQPVRRDADMLGAFSYPIGEYAATEAADGIERAEWPVTASSNHAGRLRLLAKVPGRELAEQITDAPAHFPGKAFWELRLQLDLAETTFDLPLRSEPGNQPRRVRAGRNWYDLTLRTRRKRTTMARKPVPLREVVRSTVRVSSSAQKES